MSGGLALSWVHEDRRGAVRRAMLGRLGSAHAVLVAPWLVAQRLATHSACRLVARHTSRAAGFLRVCVCVCVYVLVRAYLLCCVCITVLAVLEGCGHMAALAARGLASAPPPRHMMDVCVPVCVCVCVWWRGAVCECGCVGALGVPARGSARVGRADTARPACSATS